MRLAFRQRHRTLRAQVDAYLDGELPADQATRFEAHLAGCASCSADVRDGRELKALFASLAPVQPPRSFRLTPAMVAATAPQQQGHQPAMVLRLAQMTAGVAIMALATVGAVDFAGENSGSNEQAVMASGAAESAKGASLAQDAGATAASGETTSRNSASPPVLPTPIGGGAGAASNGDQVQPTPQASGPSQPAAATPASPGANTYANPYGDAADYEPVAIREPGGGPDQSWLRPAEFALAALAAAAATAWFFLARHSRRS